MLARQYTKLTTGKLLRCGSASKDNLEQIEVEKSRIGAPERCAGFRWLVVTYRFDLVIYCNTTLSEDGDVL